MPKIHKLSPALADMIAAGEVVERPASVIKELVENSIDAGATRITVEIQNGGITYMRVTDDGCGISAEDAPTAFLRHATSKISCADDLGRIETMGFRGEALAAISAVSKVDLMTRAKDEELGTSIRVEAGNVLEVQSAGCPQGTTMVVRDLFYNTPARMKFLKRDSVEGSYIGGAVQRQALGHPEIAFRLIRDGRQELSTPGDGKLLSAIYNVMGRNCAGDMVEVSGGSKGVKVTGFVGKPTATRGSRSWQHFFVNGRYVKSRMMMTALEEAYRNQLMVGRFPVCVLSVTIPAEAVDVNVHPAKTEVKFLRESDVFDAIHYSVLSTLNRTEARPEMVLPGQKRPETAAGSTGDPATTPAAEPKTTEKPTVAGNGTASPAPKKDFYQHMTAEEYRAVSGLAQNAARVKPSAAGAELFRQAEKAGEARRQETSVLHDSMHALPRTGAEPAAPAHTEITEDGSFVVRSVRKPAASPGTQNPVEAASTPAAPATPAAPPAPAAAEGHRRVPDSENPYVTLINGAPVDEAAEAMPGPLPGGERFPEAPETEQLKLETEQPAATEPPQLPKAPAVYAERAPENPAHPEAQPYRIIGEALKTYIIVEQGDGILLIDKHAAHERINFERLKSQERSIISQQLLVPLQAELSQEEGAILLDRAETLLALGFELEDYGAAFGNATILVRAIPSDIAEQDAAATLAELAQLLLDGGKPDPATVYDEMLHTVACKAAIKGGWDTDPKEIAALVAEVMRRDDIKYCPHGRPVCISLSRYNLEKQFKRT